MQVFKVDLILKMLNKDRSRRAEKEYMTFFVRNGPFNR